MLNQRGRTVTVAALVWIAFALRLTQALAFEELPVPFEIKTGDRVVMVGGTFIERAQRYGWLETALHLAYPESDFTIRNLGWSADTVFAESRGIFDAPAKGYERMLTQVRELKPTIILLNYGANESFKGPGYLETFLQQYRKLIKDLSTTEARFVLVGPLPLFDMPAPLPGPQSFNSHRRIYSDAIRDLAGSQSHRFIDMMEILDDFIPRDRTEQLTEDGVTLTDGGNRRVAADLVSALAPGSPRIGRDSSPEEIASLITPLREGIVQKNLMYFHHWRPQNVTYLFLFRKHEQGNNAKEVEEFKKIVAGYDTRIFDLKRKARVVTVEDLRVIGAAND